MSSYHRYFKIVFLFVAIIASPALMAEVSPDEGKKLFKNYCAQCHNKNMTQAATGPALGGASERWSDYPQEDLYNWIRNSQNMINVVKHPRAIELWNEYGSIMTAYPDLTDDEIGSILAYVDCTTEGDCPWGSVADVAGPGATVEEDNSYIYYILFGVLVLLSLVLARVIATLNKIKAHKEGVEYVPSSLRKQLTSGSVISFAIFALVLVGGYFTVNNAVNLGRQQDYAPEQPIKFSHETHAGIHGIDCEYCHDGARRSKHSVIPAANTCMNCHRAITYGSTYGTQEITKIFASVGFDPSSNKYIEGYEKKSNEEVKEIYAAWIAKEYKRVEGLKDEDVLDAAGEDHVEKEWEHIVESLTNDQKESVYGPIEWKRVHNLPDHVYFNHAQHVKIGEIDCQECHGKVEEMDVLSQHSPLSMGWCINCHRKTDVKFQGNEYYASYEKYHKEIAAGKRDKVTVADIGGLECQKCHY